MKSNYRIELTPTAEATYRRIFAEARRHLDEERTSHPKVKLLRIVDDCIDKIIPHNPCDPRRALSGALSGIFRIKKGRMRICYIASSGIQITVLYISETLRKDGDKNDPYAIFTNMVMSGSFDGFFEQLGLRRPKRNDLPRFRIQ